MERLGIECEVVTPMFLGGADGKSVELRASSIKGSFHIKIKILLVFVTFLPILALLRKK